MILQVFLCASCDVLIPLHFLPFFIVTVFLVINLVGFSFLHPWQAIISYVCMCVLHTGIHTGLLSAWEWEIFFKDGKLKLNHALNAQQLHPHEVIIMRLYSCVIFLQNLEGSNFSWGVEILVPPPYETLTCVHCGCGCKIATHIPLDMPAMFCV